MPEENQVIFGNEEDHRQWESETAYERLGSSRAGGVFFLLFCLIVIAGASYWLLH